MFGRRSSFFLTLAALALGTSRAQETPAPFYLNTSSVTNVQVNALNFINEGRFQVNSTLPWSPQNTVTFTNRGEMAASPGFEFETVDGETGYRSRAQSFYNAANGRITVTGGGGGGGFGGLIIGGGGFGVGTASILTINADAITNRGDLTSDGLGVVQLTGQSVDLTGGTVLVQPSINGGGFGAGFNSDDTNFFPAVGVYDLAYGITNDFGMSTVGLITSTNPGATTTPRFILTNNAVGGRFANVCVTSLALTNAKFWARDEMINPSNRVIQVIAAEVTDTNILTFASFYPQIFPFGVPQSGYLSPMVEFRVASTNFRTFLLETNSLYVLSQLGSHTNYGVQQNQTFGTFRPSPLMISRGQAGISGARAGTNVPKTIFEDPVYNQPGATNKPAYASPVVTNIYAAYSAQIENISTPTAALPDLGITNRGGLLTVNANELTLDTTRLRAETLLTIRASNVVRMVDSVIDAPRVTFELTSTNDLLRLDQITPSTVERLSGYLQAASFVWTNFYDMAAPDPNDPTNTVTNTIEVHLEFFAVSGRDLRTRQPVVTDHLTMTAPSAVVYADNLSVTNALYVNAPNFTIDNGGFLYLGPVVGFQETNIVNVRNFTNLGTLQINQFAEFRTGPSTPYENFVNRGSIMAFGSDIWANNLENSGDIISSNFYTFTSAGTDCFGRPASQTIASQTQGPIKLTANTAVVNGGRFLTSGDIFFTGGTYKFNSNQLTTIGRLNLAVTDILTDSGTLSTNVWQVNGGFEMHTRPRGSLFGTELRTLAGRLDFIDNFWSAQDLGATVAGFTDNLALGRLVIRGDAGSKFQFLQGAENSAIYVDVLEIGGAQAASIRDLTNRISLGLNIYYGDISSTNTEFTAQSLNRIYGPNAKFNLIWVPEWAGPASGVDVALSPEGPTRRYNTALRESATLDSDGDGVPNKADAYPFTAELFGIRDIRTAASSTAVSLEFNTTSAGTYIIEYATSLNSPQWQELSPVVQPNAGGGIVPFSDSLNAGQPQRYYRIRKAP